jgi:hypothetical protein
MIDGRREVLRLIGSTDPGPNGTDLGGFTIDVGWVRRAVGAVTHRLCRQALTKKCVVSLRNAGWVTQKMLTRPTIRLK